MLKIRVIAVSKNSQDPLQQAVQKYIKRLEYYSKIEIFRIKESLIQKETSLIEDKLNSKDIILALDEKGYQKTSLEFSNQLKKFEEMKKPITFIIGGSNGLNETIFKKAHHKISLSSMTFPHRLALVILLEQIYRAYTIIKNTPYHRN